MPGRNFYADRALWLPWCLNQDARFWAKLRPDHPAGGFLSVPAAGITGETCFPTIKPMGINQESFRISLESVSTRQMRFSVFHFGHDFADFGWIFVSQSSFGQIETVFHRKSITLTLRGMSLIILRCRGCMKTAHGPQNTSKQVDILAQNEDVQQSIIINVILNKLMHYQVTLQKQSWS